MWLETLGNHLQALCALRLGAGRSTMLWLGSKPACRWCRARPRRCWLQHPRLHLAGPACRVPIEDLPPWRVGSEVVARLAHMISSYQVGGLEQFALRVAASQGRAGHQPTLLAFHDGPLQSRAATAACPASLVTGADPVRRLWSLWKWCRTWKPELIHAHNTTVLHYAVLAAWWSGAPLVLTFHGWGKGTPRLPAPYEWSRTGAVVCVSDAAQAALATRCPRVRSRVILNGVEPANPTRDRQTVRAEMGVPDDQVVGIQVARIDAMKGHDTAIDAMAWLQSEPPPGFRPESVTLWFVGDGPVRADREARVRAAGLTEAQVRFLGQRADVPDLLAASDFFLLPSITEGLPLSMLEAMSAGLAVVATPVGGIPEVVTDGVQAILTPVGDAPSLARAIAQLVRDPELRARLGEAGRERAERDFSFRQMLEDYQEIYSRLLGGRA